jgi:hypothetical protein
MSRKPRMLASGMNWQPKTFKEKRKETKKRTTKIV